MPQNLLQQIESPEDVRRLSVNQLPELAAEVRRAIYDQVSRTGGHLAPNLGVVELTIALHYVFDFSQDRLLFDVGHQCYPHKLLTGRNHLLPKLRQRGGMAGFPCPTESAYDLFAVGHAGTAVSTAVGMARGDTLAGEAFDPSENPDGRRVVSLVGDASIVNGLAMEGLNNAGTLNRQFLVVLNDNGMGIAHPQGAVAGYFDRLRVGLTYRQMKKTAKDVMRRLPGGGTMGQLSHRLTEMLKDAVLADSWFEHFGLLSVGPVDGHDIPSLIDTLLEVRDVDRPLLLHVHTVKGKGYDFSENNATAFHASRPFVMEDCGSVAIASADRSFTAAFADALCDLMDRDEHVVACTAAMPDGTGLDKVLERHPRRSWDTGICESHAMDMMAGLARCDRKPFFAVYSTFLQRAFDQAFQEASLQGLPVRLCLDRAGLVGGDGAVHHGFCDIALLRVLPGSILMAAIDEPTLRASLDFMADCESGISAVRYPRDAVPNLQDTCEPFTLGKAASLVECDEPNVVVLAYGAPAKDAMEAAERLRGDCSVAVYDARFAKPVDGDLVEHFLRRDIPIITVEDHSLTGGFGSCVLEEAARRGLDCRGILRLGHPERWIGHGSRSEQLKEVGIDADGIVSAIRRVCGSAHGTEHEATVVTVSK